METTKEERATFVRARVTDGCSSADRFGGKLCCDLDRLVGALDPDRMKVWALNLMLWTDDPKVHELGRLMLAKAGHTRELLQEAPAATGSER